MSSFIVWKSIEDTTQRVNPNVNYGLGWQWCANIGSPTVSSGEGNVNLLQYSCLENAMDGGAWWAAVDGIAELDMAEWLRFLSFYSSFWRRKWQPTPVFLPGESHGRRRLAGCSLCGCKELDTTKQLTHTHIL